MALLSNQWLRPEYRLKDPQHTPVSVAISHDHEGYTWRRANDVLAVFRLERQDRTYELLALQQSDIDFVLGALASLASKEARIEAAASTLKELGARDFKAVLASVFEAKA